MVREDIVFGLKNAVERGSSIEKAKMSFISSGYPREEVEEASNFIHSSYSLPSMEKRESMYIPKISSAVQPAKESFFSKIKKHWKILLILGVLTVLILILVLTLIFRDSIISLFS